MSGSVKSNVPLTTGLVSNGSQSIKLVEASRTTLCPGGAVKRSWNNGALPSGKARSWIGGGDKTVSIAAGQLHSLILWGPPGVGKTTLARLIAHLADCEFVSYSAVLSGIKEIKAVMVDAERLRSTGRRTIVFIDEIHRFNKAQQDAFLPYVEHGDIILGGNHLTAELTDSLATNQDCQISDPFGLRTSLVQ